MWARLVGGALVVVSCSACTTAASSSSQPSHPMTSRSVTPTPRLGAPTSAATRPVAPSTPLSAPSTAGQIPAGRVARADHAIAKLTKHLAAGSVSIEVKDPKSGATFSYGATRGMLSGSIAKLYILEVLLWQQHGKPLNQNERALAVRMIERSDNDAANDLYVHIGEGSALRAAAAALHITHTVPGPGIYWGFDRTAARDSIALLHNLVRRGGPLKSKARSFALRLMAHVESDQRWGVSAAADKHTVTRLKDGWLPASPDNNRWLVNSIGIITAHGRRLLVAVLTQHGHDFTTGVALVRRLAEISVRALTG